MIGESRKWMVLVASIWIQAFTGTNFNFSAYSSELKAVMGMSQVELNYLSMASDMGKAFGWCSGVCLMHFPLWVVMFMAAFMGLFGYGLQWLVIQRFISLPYFLVFLLCLLAGCSICWFNTVCYVLCIKNFPSNRSLALSLSTSFNGVSAALYNLIANALNSSNDTLYLLLNAIVPAITSSAALVPIIRQPPPQSLSMDTSNHDWATFLFLNGLACFTGIYLLLLNSIYSNTLVIRVLLAGALFLLILPLITTGTVHARELAHRTIPSRFRIEGSGFNLVEMEDIDLHMQLIGSEASSNSSFNGNTDESEDREGYFDTMWEKGRLMVLGEEHSAWMLVRKWDFWLYYIAYFCGGTIGLVYSNNLGQISQSLGYSSETNSLVTLYSVCSFFGRLLSAAPDFLHDKVTFARTGWLAIALAPTPTAFLLLALSGSKTGLSIATSLIGLSSGFVFSAAASITSELFGPNSAGLNHNILITNIPIGSLLYGLLAALIYDANLETSNEVISMDGSIVCRGRKCYFETFLWWGCISLLGVVSSSLLYLRTKVAYDCSERNRNRMQFSYPMT